MSRAITVTWAVLLKDLRLLWPLAALTAALILARALYAEGGSAMAGYLPIIAPLAAGLFVLGLFQQDAPASLRHDWLTRPIAKRELLSAKALLAAAVVLVPAAAGPALAAARDGAPVGEALLAAVAGTRAFLMLGLALLVAAAVTSTLLEAAGLMIGLFLAFVFVPPVAQEISGLSDVVFYLGSGWVVLGTLQAVGLAGGVTALWLQYARRSTEAARTALGLTLVGLAGVYAVIGWDEVFAAQRAASPQDPAAGRFALARAPGCLTARRLDPPAPGGAPDTSEGPWTSEQQQRAGYGALAFWTAARPQGLPADWRMVPTHVEGQAVDARGAVLERLAPIRHTASWARGEDGRTEARHVWLMPGATFRELEGRAVTLRLDYQAALVAPVRSAQLPVDGRRRDLPGLGACSAAARSAAAVEVTCFKAGRQADLITARREGAREDQEVAAGPPDFAPDPLQLTAGRRLRMVVARGDAPAGPVVITAYEARAHVARRLDIPGLLGGPACRPQTSS